MPTESMGQQATIDAQQKILNNLKLYVLEGITEQEARGLLNRIDMFLRASPYMRKEEHPPLKPFDFVPTSTKIVMAKVALQAKRKKVVQLLEELEFKKQQELSLQKNKVQGPITIAIFGAIALLLALGIRKMVR